MSKSESGSPFGIIYYPDLAALTGSIHSSILMVRMESLFFNSEGGEFFKFLAPACDHPCYRKGESWTEELGFSKAQFRTAFDRIGVRYNSKTAFDAQEVDGRFFNDSGQERSYASFMSRRTGLTYYVRNEYVANRLLAEAGFFDLESAEVGS